MVNLTNLNFFEIKLDVKFELNNKFFLCKLLKLFIFALMKIIALSFLFFFLAFLSTPTIVSLIEKKSNTSSFYNFSEEEHVTHKFIKSFTFVEMSLTSQDFFKFKNCNIISENLSVYDNIFSSIFIPPPDFI